MQKAATRPPLLYLDSDGQLTNTPNNYVDTAMMGSYQAFCRKFVMSRNGGAPNNRLYSRLNWDGLS